MYPFPEYTSISLSGATYNGKTYWVYRLLRHKDVMFDKPPENLLYCYGIYQTLFEEMERWLPFVTFHEGLQSEDDLINLASDTHCNLVIVDDLMESVTSSIDMETVFVKGMHH